MDDMADKLRALWREVLDRDAIEDDASFLAVGGTSLDAVNLAALAQERLGIAVDAVEIVLTPVLAEQAALLARRAEASR
jgi:acyl carrier protein